MGGLKPDFKEAPDQPAEVHFWTPGAKETCFKRGQKVARLKSKVVPPGGSSFGPFGPFNVANLLRRLFQVEADLTSNSCGWNLELFEALIANSMLACVTLMCFYIGTAQLKKVHGWA